MIIHRIKWEYIKHIDSKNKLKIFNRYKISNDGEHVLDIKYNKYINILKSNKNGYLRVWLIDNENNGSIYYIHRLVASTFLTKPKDINKFVINHIDGNKLNNKYYNLEWCTISYNTSHAIKNGLTKTIGERIRVIDENIANEICKLLSKNYQIEDICKIIKNKYNIVRSDQNIKTQIRDILNKRSWINISNKYSFDDYTSIHRLPLKLIENICIELEIGTPQNEIIDKNYHIWKKYKRTRKTMQTIVSYIYKRKLYTDISKKYNF